MVDIKQLTEYIQNALETANNNLNEPILKDVEFKIFTDTGKFVEPYRKTDTNTFIEVINGVLAVGNSQITYLSDGTEVSTLPAFLSVIIALDDQEKDGGIYTVEFDENGAIRTDENGEPIKVINQAYIGNETTIQNLRLILDNAFSREQIITTFTDNDGKNYVATVIAQIAQGGQRGTVGKIGYSFTFSVSFSFTFIENGINTRQGTFLLDGKTIPFSTSTVSRVSNFENNVRSSSSDGAIENIPTFSTFQATFELPALKNSNPSKAIIDYVLGLSDYDEAHILTLDLGYGEKSYLVNIAEGSPTSAGTQNVGLQVSFREAYKNYEFLNFASDYIIYRVTFDMVLNLSSRTTFAIFNTDGSLSALGLTSGVPSKYFSLKQNQIVVSDRPLFDSNLEEI